MHRPLNMVKASHRQNKTSLKARRCGLRPWASQIARIRRRHVRPATPRLQPLSMIILSMSFFISTTKCLRWTPWWHFDHTCKPGWRTVLGKVVQPSTAIKTLLPCSVLVGPGDLPLARVVALRRVHDRRGIWTTERLGLRLRLRRRGLRSARRAFLQETARRMCQCTNWKSSSA